MLGNGGVKDKIKRLSRIIEEECGFIKLEDIELLENAVKEYEKMKGCKAKVETSKGNNAIDYSGG